MQETTDQVYETPELAEIGDYADLTLGKGGSRADFFMGLYIG